MLGFSFVLYHFIFNQNNFVLSNIAVTFVKKNLLERHELEPVNFYCEQSSSETCLFSLNHICSLMLFIKSAEYLWGDTTGEKLVGTERRKREREKENRGLME
jgi:hypothetical protein